MAIVTGDFELTIDELRVVARYVAQAAQDVLPVFESVVVDDPRPRVALDAAWEFINGARRAKLLRVTSLDAHRAAKKPVTNSRVSLPKPLEMPRRPRTCTRSRGLTRWATSFAPLPTRHASPNLRWAVIPPPGTGRSSRHGHEQLRF